MAIKSPLASKNLVLSLFLLNPGQQFTTEEILDKALANDGYNELFHDAVQAKIRKHIQRLKKEGYPIDAVDCTYTGRRLYYYNSTSARHYEVFLK